MMPFRRSYMQVRCDQCATEFDVQLEITTTKEIERASFFCPECNWEYIAYVKNESIRKQQADISNLYGLVQKRGIGQEQQKRLLKHINFLKNKVKKEMDELKKEYV